MLKSCLLYRDREFDPNFEISREMMDKVTDLELEKIVEIMENKEALKVLLKPLKSIEEIKWRQEVLKDSIENIEEIKEVLKILNSGLQEEEAIPHGLFGDYPNNRISRGLRLIEMFLQKIEGIKGILKEKNFKSGGYAHVVKLLNGGFTEEYLSEIRSAMEYLAFKEGIYIEGRLGGGNKLIDLEFMRKSGEKDSFFHKLLSRNEGDSFFINERDDAGFDSLTELKNKALNRTGNLIQNSVDGLKSFFENFKFELEFYIGAYRLYKVFKDQEIAWPTLGEIDIVNMKDMSLCLSSKEVIGNNLKMEGEKLILITGANRGGKTTFLRSIGEAQILFQGGLFILAEKFQGEIYGDVWTHFKRSEDKTLKNGKLEEELERMDRVIKNIEKNDLILFNESFSSTNERDGSIISKNVALGLVDSGVTVFFVTHNYEFSKSLYESERDDIIFLKANRERSFKLEIGKPYKKSYGEDIFKKYFKEE